MNTARIDAKTGEVTYEQQDIVEMLPSPDALRSNIIEEMASLDLKSIRALRAFSAGTATDEDTAFLIDIETQQASLRERLAALNGDTDG